MFNHLGGKAARTLTALVAVVAIAGALSSCSSSKSTSTPSTSATTSGGGGGSAVSAEVAAAQKIVATAEQLPTTIPLTTPLASAPPRGKTFVFLQCEVSQCADIATGIKAAIAAIGWNLKVIPFQSSNPATLISGLQQALQYNPVAVAFSGLPEVLWQSEIPAYQKAGVVMIPAFMGPLTTPSPVVPYDIGAKEGTVLSAQQLAAWVTADSNGTGRVLSLGVPSFPLLAIFSTTFQQQLSQQCSGCSVVNLSATIPEVDAGQVNSLIVSALQKDPSIKYVAVCDGAFIDGLPSALAAAGLTGKVKIVGIGADVANESNILSGGDEKAFTALATLYSGWLMVDAALRHVEGMPATDSEDGGLPSMLLTEQSMKANNIQPANSFNYPANYPQQFEALWHVG
jgi:ribose transport system substrate-binding protein